MCLTKNISQCAYPATVYKKKPKRQKTMVKIEWYFMEISIK